MIFLNFLVVIELIDGQTRGSLVASTISTSQLPRKMVQEAGTLILQIWSVEGHFCSLTAEIRNKISQRQKQKKYVIQFVF